MTAARSAWATPGAPKPSADGSTNGQFWRIYTGDSLEMLRAMPERSVNAVVTSPAYYWQRDYGVEGQYGLETTAEEYVANLLAVFAEIKRVLVKDGAVFLNLGDTYYSGKGQSHGTDAKHPGRRLGLRAVDRSGFGLPRKSMIGIPWRVALALQGDGWTLRSDITWERQNTIPEATVKDRPWRSTEHIFLLSLSPRYFYDRSGQAGEEEVWRIGPDRNHHARGVHYAPFPGELARRCIKCACPPGGVVLDPFLGGGTTMHEAIKLGRSAIGIDLSEPFCDFVGRRLRTSEDGCA